MKLGPRKYYKSIDFDLDTNELQNYYADYRTAYRDLGRFMNQHGFCHRQGSVYNSTEKLLETDILLLVNDLKHKFEWASTCIKAFDVTNIGRQHSMLDQLRSPGADMDLNMDITLKEESEYEKD